MPDILTLDELAIYLRLSKRSLQTMLSARGRTRLKHPLPVLKIAGRCRFRRVDVDGWLEKLAQEVKA